MATWTCESAFLSSCQGEGEGEDKGVGRGVGVGVGVGVGGVGVGVGVGGVASGFGLPVPRCTWWRPMRERPLLRISSRYLR